MASAALYGFFHGSRIFLGWGHSLEKMPFLSAVVTFICVRSSRESVQHPLGELESSGGVVVHWVPQGY